MNSDTGEDRPFVVVGIDGSEPSKQALRWARYLAEPMGARIEAVAVWHMPTEIGGPVVLDNWDPEGETREYLEAAAHEVFGPTLPEDLSLVVRQGYPAKELMDRATGALMVIVGSRGHGGFSGLLLGSVSAKIAAHAPCATLVVRHDPPGAAPSA